MQLRKKLMQSEIRKNTRKEAAVDLKKQPTGSGKAELMALTNTSPPAGDKADDYCN